MRVIEIGPMAPHEWAWVVARSQATAWASLSPARRAAARPEAVALQVGGMLARTLSLPGGAVLMAREGPVPVGYLALGAAADEVTGEAVGVFVDIWVEPGWRGRGVARRLTAAGEDRCRALGLRYVRRWVAAHNLPSLRLCQADGCHVEGLLLAKVLT